MMGIRNFFQTLGHFFQKAWKLLLRFWLFIKRKFQQLFTLEAINVLVSIIVSVLIEFFKQLLILVFSKEDQGVHQLKKNDMIDILLSANVANICLVTILVWCVTGVIRLLSNKNERKRSLLLTIAVFLGLIASICWYVIGFIFWNNENATFILCGILFVVLLIYFSEWGAEGEDGTDFYVAPLPQK